MTKYEQINLNDLKNLYFFQNPFVKKTENEKKPIESLKRA